MFILSWQDFDRAVDVLAQYLKPYTLAGIYGAPRGGLPLAVALSHQLNLPLQFEPSPNAVWVDDIVDSGKTFHAAQNKFALYVCWVRRSTFPAGFVYSALSAYSNEWIVFPWEAKEDAAIQADRVSYQNKNSL